MVRVSVFNDQGHEFFVTTPELFGKAWREKLADAVDAIEQAIHAGKEPGEVTV